MAVKLNLGPPASNKPPLPTPTPKEFEYPDKISLGDNGDVWVSLPKPDRLTIIGEINPNQFSAGFTAEDGESFWKHVMAATTKGGVGKVMGQPMFVGGAYRMVQVRTAEGGEINFRVQKPSKGEEWHKLRIELNPTVLGSDGILNLLDNLHAATGKQFRVGTYLATANITRVDVAIDLVGVRVPNILLRAKDEGKRVHYFGQTGELESVYVHRKFKPHDPAEIDPGKSLKRKGLGTFVVRAYDKVEERKSVGKPGPFGPAPVTRIEVSKTSFGNKKFPVSALLDLPNLLEPIGVGHVRAMPVTNEWTWLAYVQARRGGGPQIAAEVMQLDPVRRQELEAAYTSFPHFLPSPTTLWARWPKSVKWYGLADLIHAAKVESAGAALGFAGIEE